MESVVVDVNGWTQATSAEQTVEATVTLDQDAAENDTMTVQLVKAGTDETIATDATATFEAGSLASDTVTFTVAAENAAVAGQYSVKIGATEYGTFTVYPSATTPAEAFANGTAVAGVNQDGFAIDPADGVFTIAADGTNAKYAVPTSVMPEGATEAVDVKLADETPANLHTNFYKKTAADHDTQISALADLKAPGTYWAKVVPADADSPYAGGELYVKFVVSAGSLEGAVAYVVNDDDPFDASQTEIVYDGATYNGRIGFAVDGTPVQTSKVTYYDAQGNDITSDQADKLTAAGNFSAVIEGSGAYAGSSATVRFEIKQLDLATAQLAVDDVEYKGTTVQQSGIVTGATVNNKAVSDIAGVSFSAGPVAKAGAYTATFSAADNQKNVVNSGTASFNAVGEKLADTAYKYGNAELSSIEGATFGTTARTAFDVSDVWVDDERVDEGDYTVVLTNAAGEEVDNANAAGKYTLTVSVIPGADYALGGTKTVEFTVTSGSLAQAEVTFTYQGAVYGGAPIEYTGENVLDDLQVTVKLGRNTLVEGTDYELVVTNSDNEQVDEAVDADTYTVAVKGIAYTGTISQNVVISKAQITALRVQAGAAGVLPWTGEPVVPVVEFTTEGKWGVVATDEDGIATAYGWVVPEDAEWQVLPADQYIATYFDKDGKKIAADDVVDAGDYSVQAALNSLAKNVAFAADGTVPGTEGKVPANAPAAFTIAKAATFADVAGDAWYADSVALASQEAPVMYGYMNGIPGTNLFLPEGTITRAQTAQVLYNMAGGEDAKDGATYPSKFSDVAADAWYALPVLWASEAGIVTGIGDTGTFEPDAAVTREQAATMMYRYVKAQGQQASGSADLSAYADGDAVSGWAAEAMAWAVEAGVFGVGTDVLRPQDTLTRAEMAAISVRVQPDGAIEAL